MSTEAYIVASTLAETAVALFVISALAHFAGLGRLWALVSLPLAFATAYFEVYRKLVTFPVVGAVNKVIAIAVAGTAVGFVFDAMGLKGRWWFIIYCLPIATAFYIGWVRLADAPLAVVTTAAIGVAFLWALSNAVEGRSRLPGLDQHVLLGVVALGFAPLALLGASSSGFQLSLIFAFSSLAVVVWPAQARRPMGLAGLLGAQGGMFALVSTVLLITQKIEVRALVVLASIVFVPSINRRLIGRLKLSGELAAHASFAILCLVPAFAAIALAWSLYPSTFPI